MTSSGSAWGAPLRGRAALLIGANEGFGPAIAKALAARGATVALHDGGDRAGALALTAELERVGPPGIALAANLEAPLGIQTLVDEAYRQAGRLDLLVYAPSPPREVPLLNVAPEDWRQGFERMLGVAFYAAQAAARYMLLNRRGRIVFVGGLAGHRPGRGQLQAGAAWGALDGLTRALAVELAPKQIGVNAVAVGAVAPWAEPGERLLEAIPLHRLGTPEEVAEAVVFLASDEASYMTGEVLSVDGGLGRRR